MARQNRFLIAMKKMIGFIVWAIGIFTSGCQKRTVCETKTSSGKAYLRIYQNTYSSPAEYQQAIDAIKAQGYTCDDSI